METGSSSGLSSALWGGADTIVARATPGGRSALAVIRVSGTGVVEVCAKLCPTLQLDRPWRAQLVAVHGCDGELLERAVVIPYRAPRSYTGEDMLEVVVHGSSYLAAAIIDSCVCAGARQAGPGEFTRRAVANGKMDLLQAEAINDLIAAESAWQLRSARTQLEGGLSRAVGELRELLTRLLADLEAAVDFPTHGVMVEHDSLAAARAEALRRIANLLATARAGERIRDGVRVVISGAPNAGKSTLFNELLGRQRAIVSARPGTTRDPVEGELELAGMRVVLVDTGGLGGATDELEVEGARRARAAIAEAQAVVLLWAVDDASPCHVDEGLPLLRVRSKWDLAPVHAECEDGWLPVSTLTGQGLGELRAALRRMVEVDVIDLEGGVALARRHRRGLERAAEGLHGCDLAEPELAAEDLRWVLCELSELTGEVTHEAVLDEVFARFCIGK